MKRGTEIVLSFLIVAPLVFIGLAEFGIVPEWTQWVFIIPWVVFVVGLLAVVFVVLVVFVIKALRRKSTRDSVWGEVKFSWQKFVNVLRGASFKGRIFIILGVFLATCYLLRGLQLEIPDDFSNWNYLLVPSVIIGVFLAIMVSKRRLPEEIAQESRGKMAQDRGKADGENRGGVLPENSEKKQQKEKNRLKISKQIQRRTYFEIFLHPDELHWLFQEAERRGIDPVQCVHDLTREAKEAHEFNAYTEDEDPDLHPFA